MDDYSFEPSYLSGWSLELQELIDSSGLKLRPLRRSDFDANYLDLLGQLTTVGDVNREKFDSKFFEAFVKQLMKLF